MRAAARGIDTLIYLVGVNYWKFELHPRLMERTLAGAIAEGVARFLLIGTVYPYGRPQSPRVTEQHPREPHTFKGRMRKAQEDLLMAADREGRIRATVLRQPQRDSRAIEEASRRFNLSPLDEAFLLEHFRNSGRGGSTPSGD